jgi:hypothetical protein
VIVEVSPIAVVLGAVEAWAIAVVSEGAIASETAASAIAHQVVECLVVTAVATRASARAADHPVSAAVVGAEVALVAGAEEDLVVGVAEEEDLVVAVAGGRKSRKGGVLH